jgi:hypothetical protein
VHVFDRYLYNDTEHRWTVDSYLADLRQRYGGIDSVLIWPTYPNIGIDSRNQFDLFRAVPGGLDAITNITSEFGKEGVKVIWGYNPWDQNLHSENEPHWTTMARLFKQTGAAGFNGDTMNIMYKEFWQAGVDADYKFVGEMEGGGYLSRVGWDADNSWESMNWNTMGWGYFFADHQDGMTGNYAYEPLIDKAKFLDPRGRRMTHVNDRWSIDRHDPMQIAHFNGVGYESWENVWGVFMSFTDRDGEALKRLQVVWKYLGVAEFIQNYNDWVPYTTDILGSHGVFTSRWQHANGFCAWTLVNRDLGEADFEFNPFIDECQGDTLFDLFSGAEVPTSGTSIKASIEGFGFGAYVLIKGKDFAGLSQTLATMKQMTAGKPLSSFGTSWSPLKQEIVQMDDTKPFAQTPDDMVLIPKTSYLFQTAGVMIEGGCDPNQDTFNAGVCCTRDVTCPSKDGDTLCQDMCAFPGVDTRGVDVQFPWEDVPHRFHSQSMTVGPFYIDKNLVTNADWAKYAQATGYKPADQHNYCKDCWTAGSEKKPVTWVSLREARAYCTWAGKRLPHAWEWQLAAQGTDGRIYPWGNTMDKNMFPDASPGPEVPPLNNVGEFPEGNSPYDVADMYGLVWQFTDEFRDPHTRGAVLKGSSLFNPVLSGDFPSLPQPGNWYFPQAPKLTTHNRLLLMDDSYERAGTLGFRCVGAHPDGATGPHHIHSLHEPKPTFV